MNEYHITGFLRKWANENITANSEGEALKIFRTKFDEFEPFEIDGLDIYKCKSNDPLDWSKAENHLKDIRIGYTEIGVAGLPALQIGVNPLLVRFENGERTEDLFESIMSLE